MKNNKKQNLKLTNIIEIVAVLLILIFVNVLSSFLFTRLDLTAEKRYTLSNATKKMLRNIDEPALFRVYLEGEDLPAEYRRFRNEIKDMLDQFRAYNHYVEYEFVDPNKFNSDEEKMQFYQKLIQKGIAPIPVSSTDDGVQKQQILFPAMEVSYHGNETALQLQASGVSSKSTDEIVNSSVEGLEYNFVTALQRLMRTQKPRIGFLLGHGELEKYDLFDIQMSLVDDYSVENVQLNKNIGALTGRVMDTRDSSIRIANRFDVLVVPKPMSMFSDMDLYILDQYVMYGGKVLWLVDALDATMDSLQDQAQTFSVRLPLGLDELLFNYVVRNNSNLIMDNRYHAIPKI